MVEIEALVHRHPNKFSIETLESGIQGYKAQVAVVIYSKDRKEDDKSKFRILLTFGQHGRELITSDLALQILSILSEEDFLPKMDQKVLNSTLSKLIIKTVWILIWILKLCVCPILVDIVAARSLPISSHLYACFDVNGPGLLLVTALWRVLLYVMLFELGYFEIFASLLLLFLLTWRWSSLPWYLRLL